MAYELQLHIHLQKPVPGVSYGLQKGAGTNYDTVQIQKSTGNDLYFNLTATVKGDSKTDPEPKLTGPFVQGPPAARFVYIDIGTSAGQCDSEYTRRLKIPLTGITWSMLKQLNAKPNMVLGAQVPGTGKDGTPACATVKPFKGWQVTAASD